MTQPVRRLERLRTTAVATLAALVTVTIYFHSRPGILDRVDQIKGWDFAQFYAMGVLAAEGRVGELQSGSSLSRVVRERVAERVRLRVVPVYGPQVALFFQPFGRLPYAWAMVSWTILSVALYVAAVAVALRHLKRAAPRAMLWLMAMTWPALFVLCWFAQLSAVTTLCITGVSVLAAGGRWTAAGLVLGGLAFKPHLAAIVALWLVCERQWGALLSAAASAAAQIAVAWSYAGGEVMRQYWTTLQGVAVDAKAIQSKPYMFQSFRHFWLLLLGDGRAALACYVLTALIALGLVAVVWRRRTGVAVRYAAAIIGTILTGPHVFVYDLLVLLPVLLLAVADYLAAEDATAAWWCVLALYLLPIVSPLVALGTSVQITPLALIAVLTWMATDARALERGLAAGAVPHFAGAK